MLKGEKGMAKTTKTTSVYEAPRPVHEASGSAKIDRNIPMPEGERRMGPRKYMWEEMRVGDSFKYSHSLQSAVNLANLTSLKMRPNEFKAKMLPDGTVRIWRTN